MNNNKNTGATQKSNMIVPEKIYAANGSLKGEINLQWDAVSRARQYIIQVSVNKTQNWKHVDIISDPHYNLGGLNCRKTYSFRIAAVFENGQGPWSEPVEKKINNK